MKLKTKISLTVILLFLVFSQVFSLWMLRLVSRENERTIIRSQWEWMDNQARAFRKAARQWTNERMDAELVGQGLFRKYFPSNSVLYYQGKELINSTPYEFLLENLESDAVAGARKMADLGQEGAADFKYTFQEKVGGKRLLILWMTDEEPYSIISYRDITYLEKEKWQLYGRGAIATVVLSLAALAVLQAVIRRILAPFYRLRDIANVIADGKYGERMPQNTSDEIGQVSASFNRMADRVEEHVRTLSESNQRQRQLLGSLSHELKTPMTAIQGYAETLQRLKLSPEQQQKALEYIQQECRRLSRLSSKMLELVSLSGEDAQIEGKWMEAAPFLERIRLLTARRLAAKQLTLQLETEKGVAVWGDEDLLVSLLVNLTDNAVKASRPGQTIRIQVRQGEIFVTDHGCGIPPEELDRVTEPFYMVDKSRSRKEGGAGLGLALCAQIARLCKGELVIRSIPDQGTCAGIRWSTSESQEASERGEL